MTRSALPHYLLALILTFSVLCLWQNTALQSEDNANAQIYSESIDGDADYLVSYGPLFEINKIEFEPFYVEASTRESQPIATIGNRDPPLSL